MPDKMNVNNIEIKKPLLNLTFKEKCCKPGKMNPEMTGSSIVVVYNIATCIISEM